MEHRTSHKVAIIGAGVSGMTCALYLARANIDVCLIGDWTTTLLLSTPEIKNYPGIPSISGYDFLNNLHNQVAEYNIPIIEGMALTPMIKDDQWIILTEPGDVVDTENLVIATGSEPRLLGLENEEHLIGHGVSTCAYCDAQAFAGKSVVVVGSGNLAIEEAIYLSKICSKVTVLCRKNEFSTQDYTAERLIDHKNVGVNFNAEVMKIERTDSGFMILLKGLRTRMISADGIFYAIGSVPNTTFLNGVFPLDKNKYIDLPEEVSTTHRMYACGDVNATNKYKQVVTAAADGCNTAIRIIRDIRQHR